jgi:hypothetical protein
MTALKFSTKWYVIWPKKSSEICDDLKLTCDLLWGGDQLFSPNSRSGVGFCREKDSKNSGRDSQILHLDHLVQPVQLFLDQSLLIKGQLFPPNPRSGVGFCREKKSKTSGRDGQSCSHLVQPVQLFESTKFRKS